MKRGFPWDFALVELHAKGVHQLSLTDCEEGEEGEENIDCIILIECLLY